jgi:hypothetical protein
MTWDLANWRRECFGVAEDAQLLTPSEARERLGVTEPAMGITTAMTSEPVQLTAERLAENLSLLGRVGISVRDLKARWRR